MARPDLTVAPNCSICGSLYHFSGTCPYRCHTCGGNSLTHSHNPEILAAFKSVYGDRSCPSGCTEAKSFQHEGPPAEGKKASNPKDIIGAGKAPLELVPDTLRVAASMAFLEGALKYGRFNWRLAGVRASIYKAALDRHMASWWNGEDIDEQSGLPHLWKAAACIAILIDAAEVDKLTDDRPPRADLTAMIERIVPDVARLKAQHADKNPHQCTIADGTEPPYRGLPVETPLVAKPGSVQRGRAIEWQVDTAPSVAPGCGVDAPRPHIDEQIDED